MLIQRTRASSMAPTTCSESSVHPSPITRSSKSVNVCASTLAIAQGRTLLQLYVSMIAVTRGTGPTGYAASDRRPRVDDRAQRLPSRGSALWWDLARRTDPSVTVSPLASLEGHGHAQPDRPRALAVDVARDQPQAIVTVGQSVQIES